MSSYLTFYLVPKKTRKTYYQSDNGEEKEEKLSEGKPLSLMYYTRSSEIYQVYEDTLNPAYCGNEEKYTELTSEKARQVVSEYESDIKKTENRLRIDYKMLKEGGYNQELWDDIHSMEDYLSEQKDILNDIKSIADLVDRVYNDCGDFEKVLINVD